ncbi:hypothetical protein B0J11DRAFT_439654, partial [Dendryphion nanum]
QPGDLEKRWCWYGHAYGCDGGWCYKRCGDWSKGHWCWTAIDNGKGEWARCQVEEQCNYNYVKVLGCGGACSC